MSRIEPTLSALKAQGRKALIPFVTAGFPYADITPKLMHGMVEGGADIIELGVPFSDPSADGPVIQKAGDRALALGIGLTQVIAMVREFRKDNNTTPVVLMGYANPIERMGGEQFIDRASKAGVDGVIVVDYPPEEAADFARTARERGIDPIFLLAPTTGSARIDQILSAASGYVYYVSLRGITGGTIDIDDVVKRVSLIKSRTALPVGVGFGIRDAATAAAVARVADAVIIGTRMIQLLEEGPAEGAASRVGDFIAEIRAAIDARPGR